jgi:hypothetical protein
MRGRHTPMTLTRAHQSAREKKTPQRVCGVPGAKGVALTYPLTGAVAVRQGVSCAQAPYSSGRGC